MNRRSSSSEEDLQKYSRKKLVKNASRIKDSKVKEEKQTKKTKKKSTKSNLEQQQSSASLLEIKNQNSSFTHSRPSFMLRWDGSSNQLDITQKQYSEISPSMKVYWRHKSKNMNTIVFVQMGKMEYHAYENDAIKMHQLFNKNMNKFSKFLMTHFWYSEMTLIKAELYKQRIPIHFMNEVEDDQYRKINKIMRREVTEFLTPAINLTDVENTEGEQRFLMGLFKNQAKYGVVVVDCQTNKFFLEQIAANELRRVINKFKPVQVVYSKGNIQEQKKMLKQVSNPFIHQLNYKTKSTKSTVQGFIQSNDSRVFKILKQVCDSKNDQEYFSIIVALDIVLEYFKKLNIENKMFGNSVFSFGSFANINTQEVYDAQVYQNLQIFQIKDKEKSFGEKGTLYAYLNKCVTVPGKRKLRAWLSTPLTRVSDIVERQTAILDILANFEPMKKFQQKLVSYPDFEKKVATVYHWILDSNDNPTFRKRKNKDYNQNNNPAVLKIKQIRQLIIQMGEFQTFLCSSLQSLNYMFKSNYLKQLTETVDIKYFKEEEKKINKQTFFEQSISIIKKMPDITKISKDILSTIKEDDQQNIRPVKGKNKEYDTQIQIVQKIYEQLDSELAMWKDRLGCQKLHYVSAKARNQIEMPKGTVKTKQKQLHFSSTTAKFDRYTTVATQILTERLIQQEDKLDQTLNPFLDQTVKLFSSHKIYWDKVTNILSELDVLISFARVAKEMEFYCIPHFGDHFNYEQGIHVGLYQFNKNIVKNSLKFNNPQTVLLITGPNMGGKSTFLRQTCLLSILAQVGSLVPAKSFNTRVFDKIFCRIGASDKILEGKSTFLVELQQTKSILEKATDDSLVIIDELGRGTSTFDGISLAYGTLRYLVDNTCCLTLFSTHYSILADEFTLCRCVRNQTVEYQVDGHRIEFKYKLVNGIAEKSFAQNVGRMAGIKERILEKAREKAKIVTKENITLKEMQLTSKRFYQVLDYLKMITN